MASEKKIEGPIQGKMIVGDVIELCPEAEEVFKRHLGPYCLTVPGSMTESIEFLVAMHDYHESPLVEDLNKVYKDTPIPSKIGHF